MAAETDNDEPIIRVRGLVNRFGSQVVHEGLDLDVRRGEILGIVGGSGSGKSVLMRSIIGLRQPQGGAVEVLGVDALSEEVGLRTTLAVVQAIFMVIVLDAFFAVFFQEIGWA